MKELQGLILGSIVSENKYKEVSFLESNDFNNYEGKPYKKYFEIIEGSNNKPDVYYSLIKECKKQNIEVIEEVLVLSAYHNLFNYSIELIEMRFKSTLSSLLVNLSLGSKNVLESNLLDEANLLILKEDIFILGDNLLEYLGHQASNNTTRRINDYLTWRNKRIENVKR
ncbi:MAG: hypothetical protein JXQ96_23700 [Cyclobacteriaceae bacterium]